MRAVSFFGSKEGAAGIVETTGAALAAAPLGIKGAPDGGAEMGRVGAGGNGACASGGGMGRDVMGGRAGK